MAGELSDNSYAFTGQRLDPESGLYHFHFRKYDAEVGVWTTADPIGVLGGVNLYQYVKNNPVNYRDVFGLFADKKGMDDLNGGNDLGEHNDNDANNDSTSFGSGLENEYDQDCDCISDDIDPDEGYGNRTAAMRARARQRARAVQRGIKEYEEALLEYERTGVLTPELAKAMANKNTGFMDDLSNQSRSVWQDARELNEKERNYNQRGCTP